MSKVGDSKKVFRHGTPGDMSLANRLNYRISFFQVPSNREVSFKSMLTNYSDNFSSNWDRKEVYGRMDPIQVFQGTTRQISLAWDVVSADSYEARENLRKISMLMNMLYPSYENEKVGRAGLINTAPVFKVKFLNLITNTGQGKGGAGSDAKTAGLAGTIDGFQFAPVLEYGFHGHPPTLNEKVESSLKNMSSTAQLDNLSIYPKVINMSCVIHVSHQHQLGWTTTSKPRSAGFPYDVRINEIIPEGSAHRQQRLDRLREIQENLSGVPDLPDSMVSAINNIVPASPPEDSLGSQLGSAGMNLGRADQRLQAKEMGKIVPVATADEERDLEFNEAEFRPRQAVILGDKIRSFGRDNVIGEKKEMGLTPHQAKMLNKYFSRRRRGDKP